MKKYILGLVIMGSLATMGCDHTLEAPQFADEQPILPGESGRESVVRLRGKSAPQGADIAIYAGTDCSGELLAFEIAGKFLLADGIEVRVPERTRTSFSIQAVDGDAASACVAAPFTYLHDPDAPPIPVLERTDPPEAGATERPFVYGTAEAGAIVELFFTAADCQHAEATSLAVGSAVADETTGRFSLEVVVPRDRLTPIFARAIDATGNASACSVEPLTYDEYSTPQAPLFDNPAPNSTLPYSRSNTNAVTLRARAGRGAVSATLYLTNDCTDIPVISDFQLNTETTVTGLTDNRRYSFSAISHGPEGSSPCSVPSYTYVEDSNPPVAPSISSVSPASPGTNPRPTFTVRSLSSLADADGVNVDYHALKLIQHFSPPAATNGECAEGGLLVADYLMPVRFGPFAYGDSNIMPRSDLPRGATFYYVAQSCDQAGNCSCSLPVAYRVN